MTPTERECIRLAIDPDKIFWVDEEKGDDSNAGTVDHPFKTFHHAYRVGKGQTIIFLP